MNILQKGILAISVILGLMSCSSQKNVQIGSDEYSLINYLIEQERNAGIGQTHIKWENNRYSSYRDFNPSENNYFDIFAINKDLDLDSLLTLEEIIQLKNKIDTSKPTNLDKSKIVERARVMKDKEIKFMASYVMSFSYPIIVHVAGGKTYAFILTDFSQQGMYYSIYLKRSDYDWKVLHKAVIATE